MPINKMNHRSILAHAKRHYNLATDDFVAVDEYAMLLSGAKPFVEDVAIAVSSETFDKLKKFPLQDCSKVGYIRLTSNVVCRRLQLPENDNKRWAHGTWTLTREYLVAIRSSILQDRSASAAKQKKVSRELELLNNIDADLPLTSNKAKADLRIRTAATYLGIKTTDLILIDQTIACLVDDIAADNNVLPVGISEQLLGKVKRKVILPEKAMHFGSFRGYNSIDTGDQVYVVSIPTPLFDKIIEAKGVFNSTEEDPSTYMAYKYV